MPKRKVILETNKYYHVLNRGTLGFPIFKTKSDYWRFIKLCKYYSLTGSKQTFSIFNRKPLKKQEKFYKKNSLSQVKIVSYCLMPNHFHFLLKQKLKSGIMNFIRLVSNSYAKYFNVKYNRKGPLFEGRFRCVLVNSEPQFNHTSRYIHLNPYSAKLVNSFADLTEYQYSSFFEFCNPDSKLKLCENKQALKMFKTKKRFMKFTFDQADYQRSLQDIRREIGE